MKCQETTNRFVKTPNPAGVHFAGFEHVYFESRKAIEEQVKAILLSLGTVDNPLVRVVLGDWGDGKSELFERYLKPQEKVMNYRIIYCVASSINNALDTGYYSRMIKNEVRASVRFLTAVMMAVYNDQHNSGMFAQKHDPMYGRIAEDYIEDLLGHLVSQDDNIRIVVYIDEFEELIGQESLSDILSGIKEIVNQEFKLISSSETTEGLLAGRLHIMLACTPDAFHRFPREKQASQIFGGWERRVGKIRLAPIRKREAVGFLQNLTSFYYNEKPPEKGPFAVEGMYETLHRVSMGNVGNLVSLHAELLLRAASQEGLEEEQMCIIDPETFVEWLKTIPVAVYGARETGLSATKFEGAIREASRTSNKRLAERSLKLLNNLVANGRPQRFENIKQTIPSISSSKILKQTISHINQALERSGLPSGIASLRCLKNGVTMEDLIERLSTVFEFVSKGGEDQGLNIGREFISLAALEDLLIHRIGTEDCWSILFPLSGKEASRYFGPLSDNHEKTVLNRICSKLLDGDIYYTLSPILTDQMFPAPIPPGLEFITDRASRLNVWRKVNQDFSELFGKITFDIEAILSSRGSMKIRNHVRRHGSNTTIFDIGDDELSIRILMMSAHPEATLEDIRLLEEVLVGGDGKTHLAMLFTTGGMTEQARSRATELGLFKDDLGVERLKVVDLHPHAAKKILAMSLAEKGVIDEQALIRTQRRIIDEELQFYALLQEWLMEHAKLGFVIEGVTTTSVGSPRALQEALRFFVNCSGSFLTPEKAYEKSIEDYQKFQFYGTAAVFAPDLTENMISKAAVDLHENELLDKSGRSYTSKLSPPEQMILKMIEAKGKLTSSEIGERTVKKYKIRKTLENLYLAALEYRGFIENRKGVYHIVTLDVAWEKLEHLFQLFEKNTQTRSDLAKWGVIHVSKERDSRIILLNDLVLTLGDRYSSLVQKKGDLEELDEITQASLLSRLIEYYFNHLEPRFSTAISLGKKASKDIEQACKNIALKVEDTIAGSKPVLGIIPITDFEELQRITRVKEEKQNILNRPVEEFNKVHKEAFGFKSEDAARIGFNPKLQAILSLQEDLSKLEEIVKRKAHTIEDVLGELAKSVGDVVQKAKTYKIASDLQVSLALKTSIVNMAKEKNGSSTDKAAPRNLSELVSAVDGRMASERPRLASMMSLVNLLEDVIEDEKSIRIELKKLDKLAKKARKIFENKKQAKEFKSSVDNTYMMIATLTEWIRSAFAGTSASKFQKELIVRLEAIRRACDNVHKDISGVWQSWSDSTKKEIDELKDRYDTVSNKIPEIKAARNKLDSIYETFDTDLAAQHNDCTMEYIDELLHASRVEIGSILKSSVGESLGRVYEIVLDLVHKSGRGIVSKKALFEKCTEALNLTSDEIESSLGQLDEFGLLVELVGLSTD